MTAHATYTTLRYVTFRDGVSYGAGYGGSAGRRRETVRARSSPVPIPSSNSSASGSEVPGPVGGYRNVPVGAPGFDPAVPTIPGEPPALSDYVLVDASKIDMAVNAVNEAATEADRAARGMTMALGRSGPAPWGDDVALGQSFEAVFAESRQSLMHAVETLPTVLRGLINQLQQTSMAFTAADSEVAAMVQSLRSTK